MSRMSDIILDIGELYLDGYSAEEISETTGIQLQVVRNVITEYGPEWDFDARALEGAFESDPGEMDGDAASALASVGWGVDEDYVADNDYFDDY